MSFLRITDPIGVETLINLDYLVGFRMLDEEDLESLDHRCTTECSAIRIDGEDIFLSKRSTIRVQEYIKSCTISDQTQAELEDIHKEYINSLKLEEKVERDT